MRVLQVLFLCLLLRSSVSAQSADSLTYHKAVRDIQKAINTGRSGDIYNRSSRGFKSKMTKAQFAVGMNKFKVNTGVWKSFAFQSQDTRGWNFTATFELSNQLVSIKLDSIGRIDRLNFAVIPIKVSPKSFSVKTNNPLKSKLDLQIERLVRPYIQKGNTAGLVIAVIKNQRVYTYGYGTVNKASATLPTNTTIFEIGSVTKTFTSLLLAEQVVKGNMRLADPVSKYLPDSTGLNRFADTIKLVHLANHTSGFPRLPANIFNGNIDSKNPYLHYNVDSLYSFLVHYKQTVKPGTTFSYSNYAAGLLGTILETKLNADFGKLIRKQIAGPLGMTSTFVELPKNAQARFAQGYNENGLATSAWNLASLKGSGAVRATLNDMVKYVKAQMGQKNPLQAAIALSHETTFNGTGQRMALGWRVDSLKNHIYYHHSGGTGGFRSFVGFDKRVQLGVVILSNAADDVTEIGQAIIKNQ